MITYTLATNVTATGPSAAVYLPALNVELNNTNNTGLLHVFQTAPNGTSPTITQLSFKLEGSFDGIIWAPIVNTLSITTGASTTNTLNGGVFRTCALAPYIRFNCTTAPATTSGTTFGGAVISF